MLGTVVIEVGSYQTEKLRKMMQFLYFFGRCGDFKVQHHVMETCSRLFDTFSSKINIIYLYDLSYSDIEDSLSLQKSFPISPNFYVELNSGYFKISQVLLKYIH